MLRVPVGNHVTSGNYRKKNTYTRVGLRLVSLSYEMLLLMRKREKVATRNCYKYSFFVRIVNKWIDLRKDVLHAGTLSRNRQRFTWTFTEVVVNSFKHDLFLNFRFLIFYLGILFRIGVTSRFPLSGVAFVYYYYYYYYYVFSKNAEWRIISGYEYQPMSFVIAVKLFSNEFKSTFSVDKKSPDLPLGILPFAKFNLKYILFRVFKCSAP